MANDTSTPHPSGVLTSQWTLHWAPYTISAILAYTVLCSVLRYQRRNAMHKKFNFPDRKSFSRITNAEAQAIINYLAELEFPKIMETSLQFALFKANFHLFTTVQLTLTCE